MCNIEINQNNIQDNFNQLFDLYKSNKYIDAISHFNVLMRSIDKDIFYSHFNSAMSVYSAVFSSAILLGLYDEALKYILDANKLYENYKSHYKNILKLKKEAKTKKEQKHFILIITEISNIFAQFNKEGKFELYINIAYAYYKNKMYQEAYEYYEKIKISNTRLIITEEDKLQYLVGKAQTLYYLYNKNIPENIKNTIIGYINNVKKMTSSAIVLLSLGKLYYFIRKEDYALNYIQNALKLDSSIKIYAYDWLSRIMYHKRQYSIAVNYYNKVIELLVDSDSSSNSDDFSTIHPKPILSEMLKYLNETNEYVTKHDVHYINKTIWAGILITAIYGTADVWKNYDHTHAMILFIVVSILTWVYTIIYK